MEFWNGLCPELLVSAAGHGGGVWLPAGGIARGLLPSCCGFCAEQPGMSPAGDGGTPPPALLKPPGCLGPALHRAPADVLKLCWWFLQPSNCDSAPRRVWTIQGASSFCTNACTVALVAGSCLLKRRAVQPPENFLLFFFWKKKFIYLIFFFFFECVFFSLNYCTITKVQKEACCYSCSVLLVLYHSWNLREPWYSSSSVWCSEKSEKKTRNICVQLSKGNNNYDSGEQLCNLWPTESANVRINGKEHQRKKKPLDREVSKPIPNKNLQDTDGWSKTDIN